MILVSMKLILQHDVYHLTFTGKLFSHGSQKNMFWFC